MHKKLLNFIFIEYEKIKSSYYELDFKQQSTNFKSLFRPKLFENSIKYITILVEFEYDRKQHDRGGRVMAT